MICAQTQERGVSVSQVARRYDVNANQVFNWLKEPRFADASPPDAEQCFLPVEIIEEVLEQRSDVTGLSILEIDLVGGHRLRIKGPTYANPFQFGVTHGPVSDRQLSTKV